MVEPFSLEDAKSVLCYDKYTIEEFLTKESELRELLGYHNDLCSYPDFFIIFLKMTKAEFLNQYTSRTDKKRRRIINGTREFFDDWEFLGNEMLRLALVDSMLKRYQRGYVAAAILLMSFEHLLDQALNVAATKNRPKYDLTHLQQIHESLSKVIPRYYGHHKYVFLQTFKDFLRRRFTVLFFQYSGIMRQRRMLRQLAVSQGKKVQESCFKTL